MPAGFVHVPALSAFVLLGLFMFQSDQKRKKQKEKETIFRDSSRLGKICSYVAQTFPSDGAVMSFGLHKQGDSGEMFCALSDEQV